MGKASGGREEERRLASGKEIDWFRMLWLYYHCMSHVENLIISCIKFSVCFLIMWHSTGENNSVPQSNYTETPYFSVIFNKEKQMVNVIDFSQLL